MRHKRSADENGNRLHPCGMHRNAVNCCCSDSGMYAASYRMYGLYLFGLVCMRHQRPADKDGDRQPARRLHRDTVNVTSPDTVMYASVNTSGMYGL